MKNMQSMCKTIETKWHSTWSAAGSFKQLVDGEWWREISMCLYNKIS